MVTSNVDAVYDSHVGNHARFVTHDVVNFVLSVSIRASPWPSPPCFLLKFCGHDLEILSFSSSSSSCTCSSFSNVLTLYVAIFSRSPLVWWFFLTQRCLAPPVCSLGGPELPPRSVSDIHAAGNWGPWLICTLYAGFHGLSFHAGQCGLEGGTEIGVPSIGSCVSALQVLPVLLLKPEQEGVDTGSPSLDRCVPITEGLYLPCYLTQLLASLCSIGWFGIEFSFSWTNCLTRTSSLVYPGVGITVFLFV